MNKTRKCKTDKISEIDTQKIASPENEQMR